MRTLPLPSGRKTPLLGQGTWLMGEDPDKRAAEVSALRLGLDLGLTLIDTSEMYADGGAEEVVAEAIAGRRKDVFLISKVLPQNASTKGTLQACTRSLKRLGTDYLDLYLLHWCGPIPLQQTFEAFLMLKQQGAILDYGVSNFDVSDMEEGIALTGGEDIILNQVLFNLKHRGIEWDLLPRCRERGIPIQAYSPIEHAPDEQRGMLHHPVLKSIAVQRDATPAQIALAWVLHQNVAAVAKAAKPVHVRQNRAALDLKLTPGELKVLDRAFPPPRKKIPLEVK